MPFQSVVRYDTAAGMPGEFAFTGPRRSEPGILKAATPVGFGVSEDPAAPGFWQVGLVAGAVRFGVVTSPKQYASIGTTVGGPLAPTLVLPANTEAEVTSMGQIWVSTVTANSKPGDLVYITNADGSIQTAPPAGPAPGASTKIPGAVVAPKPGSAAPSMIVITLNGPGVA